jgi:hypothetical protein
MFRTAPEPEIRAAKIAEKRPDGCPKGGALAPVTQKGRCMSCTEFGERIDEWNWCNIGDQLY